MKIVKKCMFCFLCFILTSTTFADALIPLIYNYTDPDITIVFSEPLDVSAERHQEIADEIAGVASPTIIEPNVASPDNIICTIFGHNLSTSTVTATHHRAKPHHPRCLVEIYDVSVCSRCNYGESVLVNSFYIVCCPED